MMEKWSDGFLDFMSNPWKKHFNVQDVGRFRIFPGNKCGFVRQKEEDTFQTSETIYDSIFWRTFDM